MKLFIITGTCGSGKSTMKEAIQMMLMESVLEEEGMHVSEW